MHASPRSQQPHVSRPAGLGERTNQSNQTCTGSFLYLHTKFSPFFTCILALATPFPADERMRVVSSSIYELSES